MRKKIGQRGRDPPPKMSQNWLPERVEEADPPPLPELR
jgi:hypothetical protein